MTTIASRKNKGRTLQKWVMSCISKYCNIPTTHIFSTPMGCTGSDVYVSPELQSTFTLDIECKNQESFSQKIWDALAQSEARCEGGKLPVVVVKKNHRKPVVFMSAEEFFKLYARIINA